MQDEIRRRRYKGDEIKKVLDLSQVTVEEKTLN